MGMAMAYVKPKKTRVYKTGDTWLVTFYTDTGPVWAGYATWRRAMVEACEFEQRKAKGFYYYV